MEKYREFSREKNQKKSKKKFENSFKYSGDHYCSWCLKLIQGSEYFKLKYSLSGSVESSSSRRLKGTQGVKYFELKYFCIFQMRPELLVWMSSQ